MNHAFQCDRHRSHGSEVAIVNLTVAGDLAHSSGVIAPLSGLSVMEAPLKRVILPNGMVDWEVFHDLVKEKDFLVYDPPQMLGRVLVLLW